MVVKGTPQSAQIRFFAKFFVLSICIRQVNFVVGSFAVGQLLGGKESKLRPGDRQIIPWPPLVQPTLNSLDVALEVPDFRRDGLHKQVAEHANWSVWSSKCF